MASSSRSIYRFFSTSVARSQAPASTQRGLQVVTPFLRQIANDLGERERAAVSSAVAFTTAENAPAENEGRKRINEGRFLIPDELSKDSLYAPRTPRTRPPLLGPKNREARKIDPFYINRSSPLEHVYNPRMGQAFLNQMGRIKSRAETGLTWKSQRMVGKLVRRQRAMGIIGQWSNQAPPGGYGAREGYNQER